MLALKALALKSHCKLAKFTTNEEMSG
jgi:hypothetical protein